MGRKVEIGEPYLVEWMDHYNYEFDSTWVPIDSIKPEPPVVKSAGFVVYDDEKMLGISNSINDGDCDPPTIILKATMLRIVPLRVPRSYTPTSEPSV